MPAGADGTEPPPGDGQPPSPPDGAVDGDAPAGELGIAVTLDQFSGPMDLLLYLVRRTEVDIRDLPITTIADQFAAWVADAVDLDLEMAGDFVVMAATLLEIKARLVAPPPEGTEVPDDGEDAFDPRVGLIRKLLAYRAAKEAAFDLDRRDAERRLRHERGHREVVPDDPEEVDAWELKDVDAGALAHLWFDLLKRIDGLGPRTVIVDDVPMGVRMAQLAEAMRGRGEGHLSEFFAVEDGKTARVGIVMAVLECTRQRLLQLRQGEQYGDVLLRFRPEDERAVVSGDPGPPDQLPKRQRRPPLVTWTTADSSVAEVGEAGPGDEPPIENEEQRFLRELEQGIGVERLLARAADLEKGFIAWWEETHPGEPLPPGVVKPEPPPPPPAPEPPKAVEADAPARPKRQPPPRRPPIEGQPPVVGEPQPPVAGDQQPAIGSQQPVVSDPPAEPRIPRPGDAEPAQATAPETSKPADQDLRPEQPAAAAVPTMADPVPATAAMVPDPAVMAPSAPDPMPTAAVVPDPSAAPSASDPAPAPEAAVPDPVPASAQEASAPLPDLRDPQPSFLVVPLTLAPDAPAADEAGMVGAEATPAEPVAEAPAPVEMAAPEPAAPVVTVASTPASPPEAPAPVVIAAPEPPPDPPPPRLAEPGPRPAPTTPTSTPTSPSRPMPRPRHLKTAALAALNVLAFVVFVAWFWHPASVLAVVDGPDGAVVPRDAVLTWTLNLPLADPAKAPLPTASLPGSFAWRDTRTVAFTPSGVLPADQALTVRFPKELRAAGGFRFDAEHLPSRSVRTLAAVALSGGEASAPAFGDPVISLALNRVPADPAALLAGITVSPDVRFRASLVGGKLLLTGGFSPGTGYRVVVGDSVPAKADDRPLAWSGEIAVPQRTPGARLAAGVTRGAPAIEAVNLAELTVELPGGRSRQVLRPEAGRADIPAWLLHEGENQLVLRWAGGSAEVTCTRHDLRFTPEETAPALIGGGLPVVSQR